MQDKINLIPYRNVTLIYERTCRIIGVFQEEGPRLNFIRNVCPEIKCEAIYKLKECDYINEDLSLHLLNKSYRPVSVSSNITSPSKIHLRRFGNTMIIFKNETIIAMFQSREIDLIEDVTISKDVYHKIFEQLKKFNYC